MQHSAENLNCVFYFPQDTVSGTLVLDKVHFNIETFMGVVK